MLSRNLLAIVLILNFSVEIFSQNKISELKIGGAFSKDFTSDSEYNNSESLLSFPVLGVSFYTKTSDGLWLMYGLEYQKLGDTYNFFTGFNSERTDVDITINSLKIPLMITYIGSFESSITPIFKFGPSLDILFGESKIDPKAELNNPEAFRENIDQGTVESPLNFGINASAGIIFEMSDTNLIFEARYNRFITDSFSNTRFSTFALTLGVQIFKQ
jgi:hypothetical protein